MDVTESDPLIIADDSNIDFDISIESCTNEEVQELNSENRTTVPATKRKASEMDNNIDTINVSALNKENLLKELNTQSKKVTNAEKQKKTTRIIIEENRFKK